MNIFNRYVEGWKFLFGNKSKILFIMLLDAILIISLLLSWQFTATKMLEGYNKLQTLGGNIIPEQIQGNVEELAALQAQLDVLNKAVNTFFIYFGLLALFSLISIGAFMYLSWVEVDNIISNKGAFFGFNLRDLGKTYVLTLFWMILFLLFFYLISSLQHKDGNVSILTIIGLIVILYFWIISYPILQLNKKLKVSIKKIFSLGIRKIHVFLGTFILIMLNFFIAAILTSLLDKITGFSIIAAVIYFILLFIILSFSRIFLLGISREYL